LFTGYEPPPPITTSKMPSPKTTDLLSLSPELHLCLADHLGVPGKPGTSASLLPLSRTNHYFHQLLQPVIDKSSHLRHTKNFSKNTALDWAIDNDHTALALRLLPHVATKIGDLNSTERGSRAPLHIAFERGNIAVARVLIDEYGCDLQKRMGITGTGTTMLGCAHLNGSAATMRFLHDSGYIPTRREISDLLWYLTPNNEEITNILLEWDQKLAAAAATEGKRAGGSGNCSSPDGGL
jgi:hypothetical protein